LRAFPGIEKEEVSFSPEKHAGKVPMRQWHHAAAAKYESFEVHFDYYTEKPLL
jgi:hypothetical protein